MVQDQLVDYISGQMKLGVSRDALKSALVGAGWAAVDVEDTLKKVEGGVKPAAAATVAAPITSQPISSLKPTTSSPVQSIRMSDLISSSAPATPATKPVTVSSTTTTTTTTASVDKSSKGFFSKAPLDLSKTSVAKVSSSANSYAAPGVAHGGHGKTIIAVVIILLLVGFAGYLYYINTGLASQVANLGSTSAGVTAQLASLNNQVAALNASNTDLMASQATLMAQNQDLMTNLSFAAVPPLTSSTPTSENVSLSGLLTGSNKTMYTLTTMYGVKAFVENSKDTGITAVLQPLVGSTTTVTLGGTHVPGSQYLTVNEVNGAAVQ